MTPQDMARLHARAFDQSRPWSADEFAALTAMPGVFAVGDATAFALVRVIVDEAELLTIATAPECRRQGKARLLMTAWQKEAANRGATRAFLEVAGDNAAALSLYAACGFRDSGLRKAYYPRKNGPAADALIMSRNLLR